MTEMGDLSFFFNPKSVAVIGASNRPGSWGNMITRGLITHDYPGQLYPVNINVREVLGVPACRSLREVPGEVEVAIIAIPAEKLHGALRDCARKRVRGVIIITSGFGEALGNEGKKREERIALFGRRHGIRIIGPNVSGIFNLHRGYYAAAANPIFMAPSKMTFICQGGYAVNNIMNRAHSKGLGVGKFVHTGNEADLQCTDFLEFVSKDPETEVILMYIEGLKDPRRFLEIARRISREKPIIVYNGGRTEDGARAAASHTGAMASPYGIYRGFFEQAGCIQAPDFESILELGHAFMFYPPLRGPRVAVVTMGGSWGVMLTDRLCQKGLKVQELSTALQRKLRDVGMPYRASTRNPVDIGAAGISLGVKARISILEALLSEGEIDALVVHGFGQIGMEPDILPEGIRKRQRDEEETLRRGVELMRRYDKPLVIGSLMSHLESPTIRNLVLEGIPAFARLEEIGDLLATLHHHYQKTAGHRVSGDMRAFLK